MMSNNNNNNNRRVSLRIKPCTSDEYCLVDDDIEVCVDGLNTFEKVWIVSHFDDDGGNTFVACGLYISSVDGRIALSKDPCLGGGYYDGIESMGLIWGARPSSECRPGTRFFKKNVTTPVTWHLAVYTLSSDVNASDVGDDCHCVHPPARFRGVLVAENSVDRYYMHPKRVKRTDIRVECADPLSGKRFKIHGTLFSPSDNTRQPSLIDMFGSAGGLIESRSALLASRSGLCCLALAFFAFGELPEKLPDVQLEYFAAACEWLATKCSQNGFDRIGVIGVSNGAMWAQRLAAYHHRRVSAIVPISGVHTGRLEWDTSRMRTLEHQHYAVETRDMLEGMFDGNNDIPLHEAHCAILYVNGEDDSNLPSGRSYKYMREKLTSANYAYPVYSLLYPKTGHLIEPPTAPFCAYSYHRSMGAYLSWGGEARAHHAAQIHSWKTIQQFLLSHIRQPYNQSKL